MNAIMQEQLLQQQQKIKSIKQCVCDPCPAAYTIDGC